MNSEINQEEQDFGIEIHSSESTPLLPLANDITPLNMRQMLMICLVTFVEPVQFGMLFPFVYFMVRDFKVAQSETELGYYVGLLASSFCLAQLFSSLPWGWASDRIGRRPVILIGLLGNALTCLLFGLSESFTFAIILRSLCGLLNGNVGCVKAMLGEMTDKTNRGRAFSYWESAYGLGSIIGPMFGGLLVNPVERFPYLFGSSLLFKRFPYLLPCIVSSTVSIIGAVIGFVYLEESAPSFALGKLDKHNTSTSTIVNEESVDPFADLHQEKVDSEKELTFTEIMNPKVCFSIFCYATWCFITIIYEEVYALYVAEPLKAGGLQFSSFDIGTLLSMSGVIHLISQLIIFPILEAKLGLIKTFRAGAILMVFFAAMLPFCTDFIKTLLLEIPSSHVENPYTPNQKNSLFALLLFVLAGKTLSSVLGYIPVIIFVNDSAPNPQSLGTVHGCGQVAASLVRSIGPTFGGYLWSWSLGNASYFPLDFHFTFFIVALFSLVAIYESFYLEKYISSPCHDDEH